MLPGNSFFFFTDAQLLLSQNPAQAFGPIENISEKQFRVCSLHQANQNPRAYAICKGQICVRGVDDLHVNLVTFFVSPLESKGKALQSRTFPSPITDDAMSPNRSGFTLQPALCYDY